MRPPTLLLAVPALLLVGVALLVPRRTAPAVRAAAPALPAAPGLKGNQEPGTPTTLWELLEASDLVLEGTITGTRAFEIDPGDGVPLVLTEVQLEGRALVGTGVATDGEMSAEDPSAEEANAAAPAPGTFTFLVPGGLLEGGTRGSFAAAAPHAHELRVGRGAVVFCANAHVPRADGTAPLEQPMPVGGRAGLYNTFVARDGRTIVQGRGPTGPLPKNLTLEDLERTLRDL